MRILLIKPMMPPQLVEITGDLKSMQTTIGGPFQALYPFEDHVALVCHEEGKLIGLPLNRALFHPETGELYDVIAGTFFICGSPPDSDNFTSLTGEQIAKYKRRFMRAEIYLGGEDNA